MQIEKLNENKIRIVLSLEDLKEKNIDLHSFMANSIESQDLFYDVLDKVEKEIGFETKDYKLMIEAIAIPDGKFVLTITRFSKEFDKKKVQVKRKNSTLPKNLAIYKFNTFDDYIDFCNYLLNNFNSFEKTKYSNLYTYNSNYYLCLKLSKTNINALKPICFSALEFSSIVDNPNLFERILIEHGKIVFKTNAINNCIKSFINIKENH